jgi:hypothetical protein
MSNPRQWFRNLSLARKLTAIGVATSTTAVVVACALVLVYDVSSSRDRVGRDAGLLADVVGANSTAALTFGDAVAAGDTLRATAINGHILDARLFTRDGLRLATYARPGFRLIPSPTDDPAVQSFVARAVFEDGHLRVVRPILFRGELVGSIAVESDTVEIWPPCSSPLRPPSGCRGSPPGFSTPRLPG